MNRFQKIKQLQFYLAAQSAAAFIYYGSMHIVLTKPNELDTTFIDRAISFNYVFGYIYLSFFFLILVSILFTKADISRQCAMAIILNSVAAGIVFILFPTKMPDSVYQIEPGISRGILEFIRNDDRNLNCFPSMHISNAFTAVYFLNTGRSRLIKCIFWVWFGLIAYSVISTKQHCVYDILGGILLAVVNVAIVKKFSGKSQEEPVSSAMQVSGIRPG
jgi:membrane-associated phospholipid phosphatase